MDQLSLPDAELHFDKHWLAPADATRFFEVLREQVAWREEDIVLFGRRYRQPRLVAWYGDTDTIYTYSGSRMQPLAWIAPLSELKQRAEAATGAVFNSVLLNLYRDQHDAVGWHSDDEPELGAAPLIASVSLGTSREFQLRHRERKDLPIERLVLTHGSLLIMAGPTQQHWKHRIRRESRVLGERINLSFRRILARPGRQRP
jgi:alkylated DNA repair dioxygenase AlkB